MKITKAVIPAAGLGTRVLPATKAVPKEMLNIVDKPAIQYLVEEAAASGITDILIVTGRGKSVIEDHFDRAFELEAKLRGQKDKKQLYDSVVEAAQLANIFYVRQKETKGLGHAVLAAKPFVGDEPFAVLYGDDIIINDDYPVTRQLIDAFNKHSMSVTGVQKCTREQVMRYCSLDVEPLDGRAMRCKKIIEKPDEGQIMSLYATLGRNVVTPDIFELIEKTQPSAKTGEIYLTDALNALAGQGRLCALDFTGRRYDMGDKLGILKANCEVALSHAEIGEEFKKYLLELCDGLR